MRVARVIEALTPAQGDKVGRGRVEVLEIDPEGTVKPTGVELEADSLMSVSVPASRRVLISDDGGDSGRALVFHTVYTV